MHDGSIAECAGAYDAPVADLKTKGAKTILRLNLRAIPWVRVIVDTLLVVGILLASANLLSVR